jgi:hypothetical protein
MSSKCIIGKQAPAFKGQAVLPGGEIAEISLDQYKGWVNGAIEPLGRRGSAAEQPAAGCGAQISAERRLQRPGAAARARV